MCPRNNIAVPFCVIEIFYLELLKDNCGGEFGYSHSRMVNSLGKIIIYVVLHPLTTEFQFRQVSLCWSC